MNNGNKIYPTSTRIQARVMLYQPSQRPQLRKGDWIGTSFGRCSVTGRLGQKHADVIEAILYCAEQKREIVDGGVELLVDPARLRKTLSDSRYSMTQIQKLLRELRTVTIEIETTEMLETGNKIIGGLIDHVIPSSKTRIDPLTKKNRYLWRVRLGVALILLLENDLSLYYNPSPIARLQHGISQAVARHILSHKREPQGGWYIDTIISAVAGGIKGKPLRDARFRLKEDADKLEEIGVILEDKKIRKI